MDLPQLATRFVAIVPSGGGELEQIQFLLGHASAETTERYLGSKQNSAMQSTTTSGWKTAERVFESKRT